MVVTKWWYQVHRWPRRLRWPLKTIVFGATVLVVLFPRLWLVPVWIGRLADLNAVLDPGHPELADLEALVKAEVGEAAPLDDVLRPVEQAVYGRIPYAHDWETWGVMDYLPTVGEVFAMGREDCDGRAVVAASLLRRLGYDASLVTDLKHTWVLAREQTADRVSEREIMGPGRGAKTLVGCETGTRTSLSHAVPNLLRGLAFGIAVFPLGREIVILVALCVVTMQPRSSLGRRAAGCLLLAAGLAFLRLAGASADQLAAQPLLLWAGVGVALAGWLLLAIRAGGDRSSRAQPGRSAEGGAARG